MRDYILVGCKSFWQIESASDILKGEFRAMGWERFSYLDPDFKIRFYDQETTAIVLSDQLCGAEQMDPYPNLKTIARIGTGYDNVGMEHAKKRGIIVTRISDVSAEPVSEYALGLILSLCRNINESSHCLLAGNWERGQGLMLSELNIGIIGLGAIGLALAKKLHLLGVKKISGWNRTTRTSVTAASCNYNKLVELSDLMRESDVVALCLALNEGTKGIISKEMISLMKPTAFLVNVARGALVDEEALLEALENKKIAGAALDVFSKEPPLDEKFFQRLQELSLARGNIILTPHMANRTANLLERACVKAAQNVVAVLDGRLEGLDIVNYL